jgi:hypothetical protein
MSRIPPKRRTAQGEIATSDGVGLFYLTALGPPEQLHLHADENKAARERRCYHHIEMRPERIGRVLGTGLRVAGRVAGQRIAEGTSSASAEARSAQGNQTAARGNAAGPKARQSGGSVSSGVAGFLKPFREVGGKLWLEVTGVFFFLPVLVFAPTVWRTRASFAHGADHRTFVASAIVVAVFLYLGVSSFWRARRK